MGEAPPTIAGQLLALFQRSGRLGLLAALVVAVVLALALAVLHSQAYLSPFTYAE